MFQLHKYQQIFRNKAFRLFWVGFTLSTMGDVAARVALTWFVFELTNSSQALGFLALTYTGPVIISGLFIGTLLDRFDRQTVMIVDNLFRGIIMALIPLLHFFGLLALWHIYLASFVYGSLVMISLAGSPALLPDLVDEDELDTANALETLSYTLSSVLGPLFAGFLIPLIGAPFVVLLDAISYLLFAVLLIQVVVPKDSKHIAKVENETEKVDYSLADAGRLLVKNPILLSTTLMFMAVNLGFGAFLVLLPIISTDVLNGGSGLYGALLGVLAVGELVSSVLAGTIDLRMASGKRIGLAQVLSGLALSLLLINFSIPMAIISLFLFGIFSAPLTIWAQTLRMKIIPTELRGRTFALLRTLMQSTNPAGGMFGGFMLPLLGMPVLVALSASIIGIPGLIGLRIRALREAK